MRFHLRISVRRFSNAMAAFTRIDLVVAVGVCALLFALQIQGFATSRIAGQGATCQLNLAKITRAWTQYALDNGDRLVGNYDGGLVMDLANSNRTWVLGWLDSNNGSPLGANTNRNLLALSPLARYLGGDLGVFKCPADQSLRRGATGEPRVRSIAMNSYMGERSGPFSAGYRQFWTLSSIQPIKPSEAFVFIDEREDSINDPWFIVGMDGYSPRNPARYAMVDFPAFHHEAGANLSFADGHVDLWRWRDIRTMPRLNPGVQLALGIATPNNLDVERIQSAASRPLRP